MNRRKLLAFLIGGILLLAECALALFGWGPWSSEGAGYYFWIVIAGGPAALVAGLLCAIRWPRQSGALLWLGGAAVAMSIALRADNRLGEYFTGLALFVLPQVSAGSLFLLVGKRAVGKVPAHGTHHTRQR